MAVDKLLKHNGTGGFAETVPVQVGGGGNADRTAALDASGRFDVSMMPTGIGADTASIIASEALAANDYVNVYNAAGVVKCRKADATVAGKEANGFVLAAVLNNANAIVYFEGTNAGVSGMLGGPVFLSTTPGQGTNTPPNATGNVVQSIGYAVSATAVNFQSGAPITKV